MGSHLVGSDARVDEAPIGGGFGIRLLVGYGYGSSSHSDFGIGKLRIERGEH